MFELGTKLAEAPVCTVNLRLLFPVRCFCSLMLYIIRMSAPGAFDPVVLLVLTNRLLSYQPGGKICELHNGSVKSVGALLPVPLDLRCEASV